jgi:type VII secretion-associated serine protease mycosin
VVSTALDTDGRPVVSVHSATDRTTASALVRTGQRAPGAVGVELDATVRVADVPAGDDTYRGSQWDLATVRATDAWARSTGTGATVAVVDTGVDATHPDLAGQVLPGADFVTGTEGEAVDPHGHGTHVAGTIAALAGNGTGVAGLAPNARILPVRVLSANGSGYMSDVASGIVYAADHGADVINMSIGTTSQLEAVTSAVEYAHGRGVVVVAAAGNTRSSGSPVSYPAADAGVLAVAATDSSDNVAGYSNQGWYVDVAAPGTDILSTYPMASGEYRWMSGTSMASPHVAALAALLKGYDHTLTPDQIEQAITASAVDLGVPGRDDDFGAGRIDAAAALAAVTPQPSTPQPSTPEPSTPEPSTPEQTTEDTPAPTTPEPTPTPTPEPTPMPTETVTPTPEPTQSEAEAPAPAPVEAVVRVIRTRPGQLTIVITGADGVPTELQTRSGVGWETVQTFPATLVTRINDLAAGRSYRVVLAGVESQTVWMS